MPPEVAEARAIAAASRRINEDMSLVAGRMRPVAVRRQHSILAGKSSVGSH
ncbi:MAG: hypothetical protein HC924_01895 [Synechococcaceae cyanobacterium SM2_3_2]|nr:hypothetical protein [Synechococcaceae cyanobacterium SM2_3_2]